MLKKNIKFILRHKYIMSENKLYIFLKHLYTYIYIYFPKLPLVLSVMYLMFLFGACAFTVGIIISSLDIGPGATLFR